MEWKVYCDGVLFFHSNIERLNIFNPKLTLGLNKTGSFTFTIYPSNPQYNQLKKLKSIIEVYQNNKLMFKGRILDDTSRFHNQKEVVCEGKMAMLFDTLQRYETQTLSASQFIDLVITEHNNQVDESKRFKVGNVEVLQDIKLEKANYITSFDALNLLISEFGGYLWLRHEADGDYIDYLEGFQTLSNQTIEFGKNLLDFSQNVKGADIVSAVIPIGTEGITIASVNNGIDYLVNEDAKNKYGFICKKVEFDETNKTELMKLGQQYLDKAVNLIVSLELSAVDLSGLDKDYNSFSLGTNVRVKSLPHNIDTTFLVDKLTIDLLKPTNNQLTLGKTYETFTEKNIANLHAQEKVNKTISEAITIDEANELIQETTNQTMSSINQTSQEIYQKVSETYALKEDIEEVVSLMETEMIQTKDSFEFKFNEFNQNLEDIAKETDAQYQEINKYIKFVNGGIELGQEGNKLVLKIENEEIGFYNGGTKVAYFNQNKLNITHGEFENSLNLGNFAFLPRTNNNLTFKKVK